MSIQLYTVPGLRLIGPALLASLALIQGCGQPGPGRATHSAPIANTASVVQSQPSIQHETALRVVVKFHSRGTGRDAALLTGLARQAQAPVSYLASVAADTHVYRIEPAAGQRAADLLTRLRAMPGVAFVEIDTLARGL